MISQLITKIITTVSTTKTGGKGKTMCSGIRE